MAGLAPDDITDRFSRFDLILLRSWKDLIVRSSKERDNQTETDSAIQEDNFIPISALQHFLFCPRQCGLIHIEQIWEENRLYRRR